MSEENDKNEIFEEPISSRYGEKRKASVSSILELVKTLPKKDKISLAKKINDELQEGQNSYKGDLTNFLLQGPTMSDSQLIFFRENRSLFNLWRKM
jgi:hypothetical protein